MPQRSSPDKGTKGENVLHNYAEAFRILAHNVPGAVYICKNDDRYTTLYINNQIEAITGYTRQDFLEGRCSFGELIHPDDKQAIADAIASAIPRKMSYQLQYRMRHADGGWRWVDETGVGLYNEGRFAMLGGFIQDVTEQKNIEEKLTRIAEQNLRFFNNPVNLNAILDFEGNLIRISPSWTRMLGWTEAELKSQPIFSFVHPEDTQRTKEQVVSLMLSKNLHTFEHRLMCKDGSYRWLLWALGPDPSAGTIYASAIDISERKKSEEHILDSKSNLEGITLRLQEQNRKLDEFAHIISHNLRAPVNNIQALINLLNDNSEITDYKIIFEKLKNVAKNLSETMNELMDTLKVQKNDQVDLADIRFKEVLDKVVQSLEGELIVAHASVTFDFNEAPAIRYSKPYLESIFQNLLTNAIKYKSPHRDPAIHFKSFAKDGRITLQVKDNGQGIDMEKFGDKLFGLHKTFHNHQEARGVGLFLIKTQIESLGGSIWAESEVDKGTTFTIRFG